MWIEWYWLVGSGIYVFAMSVINGILLRRLLAAHDTVADLKYLNERANRALHDKVLSQ